MAYSLRFSLSWSWILLLRLSLRQWSWSRVLALQLSGEHSSDSELSRASRGSRNRSGGGPSPLNDKEPPPRWAYIVEYAAACIIVTVWLVLIVLDALLPSYDVPVLLYMVVLVVIVFLLPGSEAIATILINAVFRRGDKSE